MANEEHLAKLREGVKAWNKWREEHPMLQPDLLMANLLDADLSMVNLRGADLRGANAQSYLCRADLRGANLSEANFSGSNLTYANLVEANLSGSDLSGACLWDANLRGTKLSGANLSGADLLCADLSGSDLSGADITEANLFGAKLQGTNLRAADLWGADLSDADLRMAQIIEVDLSRTTLVGTNLEGATLSRCRIYGISAWDLKLDGTLQDGLIVTRHGQPTITVDNLEVAQFIYLLLNNEKLRDIIDTITSKVVLILGRFKPERKVILDAFREELRKHDYLPVMFDTEEGPESRDVDETVSLLARMARFVIADITEARCVPQELKGFVESNLSIPVLPCIAEGVDVEYGMFDHFERYMQVLPVFKYKDEADAIERLPQNIQQVENKVKEQRPK